tara:strand:+ start:1442 stop:1729 length:288 start_codon:yes stop_codon:yes gene_type:complete
MSNEQEYSDVPYQVRDEVGFPQGYYELSYEQQRFVDFFLDTMTEMRDNIKALEEELEASESVEENLENTIEKLEDRIAILQKQLVFEKGIPNKNI